MNTPEARLCRDGVLSEAASLLQTLRFGQTDRLTPHEFEARVQGVIDELQSAVRYHAEYRTAISGCVCLGIDKGHSHSAGCPTVQAAVDRMNTRPVRE